MASLLRTREFCRSGTFPLRAHVGDRDAHPSSKRCCIDGNDNQTALLNRPADIPDLGWPLHRPEMPVRECPNLRPARHLVPSDPVSSCSSPRRAGAFAFRAPLFVPGVAPFFVNRSSYGPTPSHSSFLPVASVVHVGVSAAGKFQQESLPKFVFRVLISNGLNSDRCTCFTGRLSTGNADPCCGTGASGLCAGTTKGALDVGCPWPESSAGQESSVTRSASKPLRWW
jgi:hypothetical protein